jgi:hypothetical protein
MKHTDRRSSIARAAAPPHALRGAVHVDGGEASHRRWRYRGRRTTVIFGLACVLALMLTSGSPAFRGHRVYVASNACAGKAYRPSRITIACGTGQFYAARIKYSTYDGAQAKAHATLYLDNCRPDCASGKFKAYPGRITMRRLVRCHGRLYYSRISWRFVGVSPTPAGTGTENIQPFFACSGALG